MWEMQAKGEAHTLNSDTSQPATHYHRRLSPHRHVHLHRLLPCPTKKYALFGNPGPIAAHDIKPVSVLLANPSI